MIMPMSKNPFDPVERIQEENGEARDPVYVTDARGIIRDPGKFEGQPLYVPYFYDLWMDGCADDEEIEEGTDDAIFAVFKIDASDVERFPSLAGVRMVKIWTDDQGFVCHRRIECDS